MTYSRLAHISLLVFCGCNPRFAFDVPGEVMEAGAEAGTVDCTDQCATWGQQCAPEWHVCVECNQDLDCTNNPSLTRCSADHRCVQCKTNLDCGAGSLCVATNYECRTACVSGMGDDVCGADDERCGSLGVCAECDRDVECTNMGRGTRCLDNGICVACRFDSDCSGSTHVCDSVLHQCVECSDGRNCSSGACNQVTHHCY